MFDFVKDVFDPAGFMPRWHCGLWTPGHGYLHIISDVAIWLAYFAIPCILTYFGIRRADLPYRSLFWLFGMFIFACGTTHLMEAIIFWWPAYRLAGVIKFITAVVSWGTVLALVPVIPGAMALRSPQELEREIAERKLVEARLRESEQRFRGLLETAPDGMVIIDRAGRIELVNAEVEELFGYRREDLIGTPVVELFPPQARAAFEERQLRPLQDGAEDPQSVGEHLARRADGSEFPVEVSVGPVTDFGALATVAIRDISERRRAEQRILQSERLSGIGQTVAGLAHEGRNALQQIQSCAEMLRLRMPQQVYELELVAGIEKAQDRLHRLFEEVRGFAAPLNLQYQKQDLIKVWREAWDQLAVARRDRDVQLVDFCDADDTHCNCDSFQLQQVFRNLMENSMAACKDPVKIEIHCQEATVDGRPALQVSVRDNGPGFTAEQRSSAFEAFYTTKTHGTGLGLAIAKRIVEAHGGRIEVGPALAGGAEIIMRLPKEG